MECKCLYCGGTFEVNYPCFVRTRRFCSKLCSTRYRWEHTPRNFQKFVCEICGKEFEVRKSDHRIKEGKPIRYCSQKCAGEGSKVGSYKVCPACGKAFYSTRTRFCSRNCVIQFRRNDEEYKELLKSGHWKPTHVYSEKYLVSDRGEVFSVATGCFLKPTIGKEGYYQYNIGISRKDSKRVFAHRLVACAFIPNPKGKPQVDHINGNRSDNRVENLRWATAKENVNNPITIPKHREAVRKNALKMNDGKRVSVEVYKDGTLVKVFPTSREAAKYVGSTPQNVSSCLLGRRKTAKGYTFKRVGNGIEIKEA